MHWIRCSFESLLVVLRAGDASFAPMPNKFLIIALGAAALGVARVAPILRRRAPKPDFALTPDESLAPKLDDARDDELRRSPERASIKTQSPLKSVDAFANATTTLGLDERTIASEGIEVVISTFGATVVKLKTRRGSGLREGGSDDVVLGYDDIESYDESESRPYFGAICGRVANRIANGEFKIRNKTYTLAKNNGENALHGGARGWDRKRWRVEEHTKSTITMSYESPDGDEGFPGNVKAFVVYSVVGERERVRLVVDEEAQSVRLEVIKYAELTTKMTATTDSTTPVSTVQHTYFNLHGHASLQDCGAHVVEMPNCHAYVPVDDKSLIPTGEGLRKVDDTAFDLRSPTPMFDKSPEGYDQSFVIAGADATRPASELPREAPRLAARVTCKDARRALEVYTDAPGVHFYTGNFLSEDMPGNIKDGARYAKQSGFCLETGWFPDAVNQNAKLGSSYPSVIINRGDTYSHTLTYRFLNI